MKYIKFFENFIDDILDKISKHGINSLTKNEKDYLNANSSDNIEKMKKIELEIGKKQFISSNNLFSFDFDRIEDYGDEVIYYGTVYVPSITQESGNNIDGTIEGSIEYRDGVILPNFEKEENGQIFDVSEFTEGLEHEFYQFLQSIIDELEEE